MTSNTALGIALRRRWPGADGRKALMKKLGITMDDLLKPAAPGGGGSTDLDGARALRLDIENNFLAGMQDEKLAAALLAIMDKHVGDQKRLDADDPRAGRVREIVGDDELQKARDYLMGLGLSADDVERAIALARGDTGASDVLPTSGPGGLGGAIGGRTRSPGERVFAADERRRAAQLAYDKTFPNAVVVGPSYCPDRGRDRSTSAFPDERQMAEYWKRFGGEHVVTNG